MSNTQDPKTLEDALIELAKLKKQLDLTENDKSKSILKTAKGTRDFAPRQMALREKVFKTITDIQAWCVFVKFDVLNTHFFTEFEIYNGHEKHSFRLLEWV